MARLSIPDEQTFAEFTVTTPTTAFPITFRLISGKADLVVLVDGVALDASAYGFTGTKLDGGGYVGGTVTLNAAVDDVTVRIERDVSPTRTSQFATSNTVPVGAVDMALNRLTAAQQDLSRKKLDAPTFERAGKFLAFDAEGDPVAASGSGADGALRTDLAQDGGGALIGHSSGLVGSFPVSMQYKGRETISVREFGALLDGETDDAAGFQAAIDACQANDIPVLLIDGPMFSSSVNIDRMVDTTQDCFVIRGAGIAPSIRIADGETLFDSTFAITSNPLSERVCLDNITIRGDDSQIFSQAFLRCRLIDVTVIGCRIMNATIYSQDWDLLGNCLFSGWKGVLFKSKGSYAIFSEGSCQYRNSGVGGHAFEIYDVTGTYGAEFNIFGKFESLTGSPIRAGYISTGKAGGYVEGCTGPALRSLGGINASLSLGFGEIISTAANAEDSSFYEIEWGVTANPSSIGARASGRLHNDTDTLRPVASVGETAVLSKFKVGPYVDVLPQGCMNASKNITAHAGGGKAGATAITTPVAYLSVVASAGDSVGLPTAKARNGALSCKIINFGAQSCDVFPSGSDLVNFGSSAVAIASGSLREFICINDGNWLALPAVAL